MAVTNYCQEKLETVYAEFWRQIMYIILSWCYGQICHQHWPPGQLYAGRDEERRYEGEPVMRGDWVLARPRTHSLLGSPYHWRGERLAYKRNMAVLAWFVVVVYVLLPVDFTHGLYFHMGETEKKCFIEEIPDETMVTGEFFTMLLTHEAHSFECTFVKS